ncbi:MAG: KamA family radical SAM protein, partial [Nitrospinota bacterium]
DPSGEMSNTKIRGLQHKYSQTALLLVTNNCATYCRHCFRKRFVGVSFNEIADNMDAIIGYINDHTEITNVLISGGDPLTLPTDKIIDILDRLSVVKHIQFIRIGTRIPVVLPSRISEDAKLTQFLGDYSRNKKQIYINTQFNHPTEITPNAVKAIDKLLDERVLINNQTVLLKGVNDNAALMAKLQQTLTRIGIIPYYIFQCRPVKGVKNIFQVPLLKGNRIVSSARRMLDGPSKRFRFVMSHKEGKIEIIGREGNNLQFRYHQTKDSSLEGKIFSREVDEKSCWLTI